MGWEVGPHAGRSIPSGLQHRDLVNRFRTDELAVLGIGIHTNECCLEITHMFPHALSACGRGALFKRGGHEERPNPMSMPNKKRWRRAVLAHCCNLRSIRLWQQNSTNTYASDTTQESREECIMS
eukprot:756424-Pelagomonas_calceolata.AAC.9